MSKEKFDDETLINVAKKYYHAGCYDNEAVKVINEASDILSTAQRNVLVKYVNRYHDTIFKNLRSGLSMRQMRDGLLKKAGAESLIDNGYAANVSATQLRAIYNYVMGIDQLKEDNE